MVQSLRPLVSEWRESGYAGASETTRVLFSHWFERGHELRSGDGSMTEFRYYFCQREAIETFVYLREMRPTIRHLSQLIDEFGGPDAHMLALGVPEAEDALCRYAFKIATGAGKTKIMSLAIAWSYFHALRESDSREARHFVVIAPNLTVYERLKDDFSGALIFARDPVIPPEWAGDWNMSVVLQDGAGGGEASSGAVVYLTNIHRLYEPGRRAKREDYPAFLGPSVSKSGSLDTGENLRERISSHGRIMILNDEAHHVWDPDSAWNEAIAALHEASRSRGGEGVVSQLDFSATPKDAQGQLFKHIVCDTPLGEAVDAGIVKTPVIGSSTTRLAENASDDAAVRYEQHLLLGYECWKRSATEWEKSGKKSLLFVMCEDTEAADSIAKRLDSDPLFEELHGRTINLHTNLKGKLKKIGTGLSARYEFQEDEKSISDDDLRALRELSRELDSDSSPYSCIVSVLMLREGWDVRNVTTIVPLRAFSAQARILPEQTLGRGLRRMTPPGMAGAHELVTVVEHPAFAHLYDVELAQEGLFVDVVDADELPKNTVSIFPSPEKDLSGLEIELPVLDPGYGIVPSLPAIDFAEVREAFRRAGLESLPLGAKTDRQLDYEGKTLITGELVERFTIELPLTKDSMSAISYFRMQIEEICKIRGTHRVLSPLIERFITELLFGSSYALFDERLRVRLGDPDVAEYVRAVFVPLVRSKVVKETRRAATRGRRKLSAWKPFQVTQNERHPTLEASSTLFNLVSCNRALEVAFTKFIDSCTDVAAFAKNAGPEALRIDYVGSSGVIAFYTPDFFARLRDGAMYLIETKGEEDIDVPRKAKAAMAWCAAAGGDGGPAWDYVYVPQGAFQRVAGNSFAELVRSCAPARAALLQEQSVRELPLFAAAGALGAEEEKPDIALFAAEEDLAYLPERYRKAVEESAVLFRFLEHKSGMSFAPAFNALLGIADDAATRMIKSRLGSRVPYSQDEQRAWFGARVAPGNPRAKGYADMAANLKRTLVFGNGLSPVGLLRSCLEYAAYESDLSGGIFAAIREEFAGGLSERLLEAVSRVNDLRNHYIAHQEKELGDHTFAEAELRHWISTIVLLCRAAPPLGK
jgi:type III restriction enzyme